MGSEQAEQGGLFFREPYEDLARILTGSGLRACNYTGDLS